MGNKKDGEYKVIWGLNQCFACEEREVPTVETYFPDKKFNPEGWLTRWHLMIDHLASGKDIESYFSGL